MDIDDNIQLNIVHSNMRRKVNIQNELNEIISQQKNPQSMAGKKLLKVPKQKKVIVAKTMSANFMAKQKKKKEVEAVKKVVKAVKKEVNDVKATKQESAVTVVRDPNVKSILKTPKPKKAIPVNDKKRKRVSFGEGKGGDDGDNDDDEYNDEKQYRAAPKKKFKSSSLFLKNPTIPRVDCEDVTPINENVFSKASFSSAKLHPFMVSNLERLGMTKMTAVQRRAIPMIMKKKDLLVKSQTGSGKTLCYAVPIIESLQSLEPKVKRSDGPYCIVIVPTRELVVQTTNVLSKLTNPFCWLVTGCLMGGEKKKSEKARLRKGVNIIVSTPGRLVDHLDSTASLELSKVKYLVIDEADRMLELGFERFVSRIILVMNQKCTDGFQTILLSATLSPGVEKLSGMTLKDPVRVDMALTNKVTENGEEVAEELATPASLKHHFVVVPSKLRLVTLAAFILWKCQLSSNPCKVIVFLSTQDSVEFHHSLFNSTFFNPGGENDDDSDEVPKEFELYKLYGDMEQKDRMKIFSDFHSAKSGVLLCTDVASRGLDMPHIEWIVQYNTPGSPADYVHRVGRTARIGTKGNALLFLAPSEVEYVKVMAEQKIAMQEVKMDDILKTLLLESQMGKLDLTHKGNRPNTLQDSAAFLQAQFENNLADNMEMRTMARKAYQSFIKAYSTYPAALKHIFHIKRLHLGHLATSFALSEPPSSVTKLVTKYGRIQKAAEKKFFKKRDNSSGVKRVRAPGVDASAFTKRPKLNLAGMSEFDSGI